MNILLQRLKFPVSSLKKLLKEQIIPERK